MLVATDHTLFLLDVRQPGHALLAIQHQLTSPPFALSAIQTNQGNSILQIAKTKDESVQCYVFLDGMVSYGFSDVSK